MLRGELWWANLPDPVASARGYRRPVVIIQADSFTNSCIATVIIAATTSNLRLGRDLEAFVYRGGATVCAAIR